MLGIGLRRCPPPLPSWVGIYWVTRVASAVSCHLYFPFLCHSTKGIYLQFCNEKQQQGWIMENLNWVHTAPQTALTTWRRSLACCKSSQWLRKDKKKTKTNCAQNLTIKFGTVSSHHSFLSTVSDDWQKKAKTGFSNSYWSFQVPGLTQGLQLHGL